MDRTVSSDLLVLDLAAECGTLTEGGSRDGSGRQAKTLLKNGPLRVTVVRVSAGGEIADLDVELTDGDLPAGRVGRFALDESLPRFGFDPEDHPENEQQ